MVLQIVQGVALGPVVGIIKKVAEKGIPALPVDEPDGLHTEPPWPVRHEWIVQYEVAMRQPLDLDFQMARLRGSRHVRMEIAQTIIAGGSDETWASRNPYCR